MKALFYIFLALALLTSCESDPEPQAETRVYQVKNRDGASIPITTVDNLDGTGTLTGNLLFDMETLFESTLDYVNDDRTNFSLSTSDESLFSDTFSSGTGFYTSDSIFISIVRDISGIDIEEAYEGNR